MTQERLLNFINQVIIKHTEGTPAALFLDTASINRSDITRELCNKNNITIVPIPYNTTAWLQPCDVVLFGPARQKNGKQYKLDRQLDIQPTLQRTGHQFSVVLQSMSYSAVKRTWDRLRISTPEQLRHKSSSTSLKRARTLFTGSSSSQP